MKNILVLLHDDPGQEARLQAGLDLTRALNGHLTCLDVCQPPPVSAVAPYGMVEYDPTLLEEAQTREEVNRASIEQRLAHEDVPWSMADLTGDIAGCIADHVGLADVVVLNRRLDDFLAPDMLGITSELVLRVQKPIVAMPENGRGFNAAGTAVIAWDGTGPAMAALTASVPLLAQASSVFLVEVVQSASGTAEEAASYLSRHDISVEIILVQSSDISYQKVVELIQSACVHQGASYCVMGAYGHSRLRESVFGGVTRAMLKSSAVPLVIAH